VSGVEIARLDAGSFATATSDLAKLLTDAVEHGASVGFVPPFTTADAEAWWRSLSGDVSAGRLIVLVARADRRVVGTAQLRLAQFPNARHRAEVAKVLVGTALQRRGIGRALMAAVEEVARGEARTLLYLDTETGSEAERFYDAIGWTRVGRIPGYAENPGGGLRTTSIYYKEVR
jgi:ribosomal protein S18 acetylase RimI-like enzyme